MQLWAGFRRERFLHPTSSRWASLASTMQQVHLLCETSATGEPFVTVSVWVTDAADLHLAQASRAPGSAAAASAPPVAAQSLSKRRRITFSPAATDPNVQVTFRTHEFSSQTLCVDDHETLLRRAYSYVHVLAMFFEKTLPASCESWTLDDVFKIINSTSGMTNAETPTWGDVRVDGRHVWSHCRILCSPPGVSPLPHTLPCF